MPSRAISTSTLADSGLPKRFLGLFVSKMLGVWMRLKGIVLRKLKWETSSVSQKSGLLIKVSLY